jgi:hypothetical protein
LISKNFDITYKNLDSNLSLHNFKKIFSEQLLTLTPVAIGHFSTGTTVYSTEYKFDVDVEF